MLSKLRAEGGTPSADLWFGGGIDAFMSAKDDGLLEPVTFDAAAELGDEYKDTEGYWYSKGITIVGFLLNNSLMEELGLTAPESWDDLTDSQYEGESVMAHCREAVQDKGVEMRFLQANDPSAIAKRDGYGYRTVVESFQRYYPEAVFIPSMTVGATDAHRYEEICDTCLRCSPFMTEPAEAASGRARHDERLLVRSYLQGIRVLIDLMEHANVEP